MKIYVYIKVNPSPNSNNNDITFRLRDRASFVGAVWSSIVFIGKLDVRLGAEYPKTNTKTNTHT